MSAFYGVYRGHRPGVYTTWAQCQGQTQGYKGAVFKKFKSYAEAQNFVETGRVTLTEKGEDWPIIADNGELNIFTDGAFSSKTKRCGVGVAWDPPFQHYAIAKQLPNHTTNQQAELDAIVSALWTIDQTPNIKVRAQQTMAVIWTDSDYSCRCLAEYIHKWRENGWMTASGAPVKHKKLIQDADRLITKLRHVRLRHISEVGLSSHTAERDVEAAPKLTKRVWHGNRRADELARGVTTPPIRE